MSRTPDAIARQHLQESLMQFRQGDLSAAELIDYLDEHVRELVGAYLAKRDKDVPTAPPVVASEPSPTLLTAEKKIEDRLENRRQLKTPDRTDRCYIRIIGPSDATDVTVGKRYLSFHATHGFSGSKRFIFNDRDNVWWLPPTDGVIDRGWPAWEYASDRDQYLPTHLRITNHNQCQLLKKPALGSVHGIIAWDNGCPQIRWKDGGGLGFLTLSYNAQSIDLKNLARISWAEAEAPKANPTPQDWIRIDGIPDNSLEFGRSYPVVGLSKMTYGDPIVTDSAGNLVVVKTGYYSHSEDPVTAKVKDQNGVVLQYGDLLRHSLDAADDQRYRVVVSIDPWQLYFMSSDKVLLPDPSKYYIFRGRASEDLMKKAEAALSASKENSNTSGV